MLTEHRCVPALSCLQFTTALAAVAFVLRTVCARLAALPRSVFPCCYALVSHHGACRSSRGTRIEIRHVAADVVGLQLTTSPNAEKWQGAVPKTCCKWFQLATRAGTE